MTTEPRLLGGRYEIGEVVGYGGMAEVHRGRDLRLGRDVAVKLLRADLSRDESFLIRFQREAQNSASLNHPNIVAVFDTGEDGGIPYMVMEFVNGRTLKEVLLAEGRFDAATACEVVADMCSALDFSHKHHIIHRDVKPGNVMLSDTNQVKVMDFGIARALASNQATMTQTSAVIGTAQYLSPEQARGETVDARSDVYAVGCVLYELLVGHPPFTGDNPVSVAYQHVREEARPPSELNPAIPASVDAVIMKALAKNPENRYHSAGEMREDLIRAARGQAVMAPAVMNAGDRTQLLAGADSTAPITPIATSSSKRRPWLIALGVILSLIAVTAASWGIMKMLEESATVAVPNVVGQERAEAETTLTDAGFEVTVEEVPAEVPDDENIGRVTDQDPDADTEVSENSEVTLTVMIAPEDVTVQDVVGDKVEEATEKLEGQNLTVKVVQEASTLPSGEVLEQTPKGGSEVPPTTEVTLTVSEGGRATVPDVFGMTVDRATQTLDDAGFGVQVEYGNGGEQEGVVYAQDPGADSNEEENSTVTITAQGVVITWDATTAPAALQTTLQGLGLTVTIEGDATATTIESVTGEEGQITSGTAVKPGAAVTITAAEDDGGGGGDETTTPADESCTPLDPTCNNGD
ncbi:Stk1 family PASTA domain-containing Ser/Thr kinase [Glycomyces algeriensis]|uniref:non-specific serine/threonine protein kinase n=1 Tax=Glycomyces algeriensis TaxID=256037 RepID=A0A9W6LFW0_9ACTN|nr:Stk1 family PASTA domain-containing Ser/Thr kinase [Glycomyces algeriensis]MDA1368169.1 Stk1 family PASTA domain-containing Ser/Thr kinase [Glycomyces algeriensis]MDR7348847.1 serine/threonine-protein kinase [Glycomyces algeriensis]GLI41550.1 serine/threonine protein kinase [Glycomyces algeriensis]